MGRRGDGDSYLALLEQRARPSAEAALRSTFIAGFPGETDDDVEELIDFIDAAGLAVAGVFAFDPQEGTAAAALPDQVPAALREERAARVGDAVAARRPLLLGIVRRADGRGAGRTGLPWRVARGDW